MYKKSKLLLMFIPAYKRIPVDFIGELSTILVSSVKEIIDVRIDQSITGAKYLVIPFPKLNSQFAILVEISDERLAAIKNRAMQLIFPFMHPEKKHFFLAELDNNNQINKLAYLLPQQRKFDWPIADNLDFNLVLTENPSSFNLREYAIIRNRGAIEVIFEAEDLEDNMKIWSFKNFLIPFTELIKTAILSNNLTVNNNNVERKLKLGFTKIEHKCLRGIIEFDFNPRLMEENIALENLKNMYLMLDADEKEILVKYVDRFANKKIISDTIKILRAIITNKGIVHTQMATPDEEFKAIMLNRSKSSIRKKMLETNIATEPYPMEVTGVLTMINFETRKQPLFALHSIDDDQKYYGRICREIAENIDEQTFKFNSTEYKCQLEVTYTPETTLTKEKYEYILMGIDELQSTS